MRTLEQMTADWRVAVGDDAGLGGYSVKYDLRGDGYIFIDGNTVSNEDRPADLTFSAKIDVIDGILAGTINPTTAMVRGKVKVSPMKVATKIGPQLHELISRLPKTDTEAPQLETEIDHPLPPRSKDMILATPEMFMAETSSSFDAIPGFEGAFLRITDVKEQTGGRFDVNVIKANPDVAWAASPWHMHHHDISLTYILEGWADFEFEGIGVVRFSKGMIMNQPAFNRHREGATSPDFQAVVFSSPAKFATTMFVWNEETGQYDDLYIDDTLGSDVSEFGDYQAVS